MPVPTNTIESSGTDPGVSPPPIKQLGTDASDSVDASAALTAHGGAQPPAVAQADTESTAKAQDPLIRVQELERQLAALTSKARTMESDYSDQLRTLTEALARKSATLESTRLRASRLEFAQREAIHFLTKPLANSQDAIAAAQHSQVDIQLTECVRFALQYLKAAHKAALDQQPVSPIMDTKGAPGPLGVAIEKATAGTGGTAASPATPMEDNIPLSRLATANAAAAASSSSSNSPSSPLSGMAKGGANSRSMSTPPGMSLASAILEEPTPTAYSPQVHVSPASPKSPARSPRPAHGHGHGKTRSSHYHSQVSLAATGLGSPSIAVSTATGTCGTTSAGSHARSLSMSAAAHLLSRNTGVVASDPMGLSPRESDLGVVSDTCTPAASASGGNKQCGHCRTLALQLDAFKDALSSSTSKLTDVERTLDYERVLRSRVQIAKDLLETELEELTSQLFSEANRMVEEEARRRDALESVNRGLARQLERMREEEVRRTLERAARTRKVSGASGQPPGAGSMGNLFASDVLGSGAGELVAAGAAAGTVVDTQVYVDAVELNAFQDFVRRVTAFCPPAGHAAAGSSGGAGASGNGALQSAVSLSSSTSHILPHPTLTSFTSSSTSSAAAIAAAIAATGFIPWTAIDSDPLVKRCMTEDIEPCLFARTPHLHSSTNAAAALVSVGSSFKKRLMEALASGNVDIVPLSRPGSPASKDKDKDKVAKVKCCVCGVARTCGYSLRLNAQQGNPSSAGVASGGSASSSSSSTSSPTSTAKQPGTSSLSLTASFSGFSTKLASPSPVSTPGASADPSFSTDACPIDLFCRDRILATRDFYCWIRRLPTTMQTGTTLTPSGGTGAGASHRPPIVELFRVYLAHRRRMAEARVGSAGLFRDGGYGGVGDYANILISH